MGRTFFLIIIVTLSLFLAYTSLYQLDKIAMAITIFFIFSTLFHLWAIEKAQKSDSSTGFFRWIYGSIAIKMITVVALAYYLVFILKAEHSLVMLLIANYFLLSLIHVLTLKKHSL